MSMEEEAVEILVHAWGLRTPESIDSCIDLCLVDLKTGQVTSCGGNDLYGANPYASMVALGHEIYIVSGVDPADSIKPLRYNSQKEDIFVHSKVSRINVDDIDGGWKNVTPFNTPTRRYKYDQFPCVTLNNKLYVFGDTFGEVYDPKSPKQWARLPPVLQDNNNNACHVSFPVLADPEKKRIIVHLPSLYSIYAYYLDECKWECLVKDFDLWSDVTVLFDDMLLFHFPLNDPMPIAAYDLEAKEWLNPVFDPETDTSKIYRYCDFFHALIPMEHPRGTFYLASSLLYPYGTDDQQLPPTTLIFVKFTFHRSNNSGDPVFKFISSQKLDFNWPCRIYNYLPVVGKMSRIKDTLVEVSAPLAPSPLIEEISLENIGASSFEKHGENAQKYGNGESLYHCTTQRSSKQANDNVRDCSLKSTAELVNPSGISIDERCIWTLLKDMEVADNIACALVKDPNSLTALLACPIQKRKKVLEILMQAY